MCAFHLPPLVSANASADTVGGTLSPPPVRTIVTGWGGGDGGGVTHPPWGVRPPPGAIWPPPYRFCVSPGQQQSIAETPFELASTASNGDVRLLSLRWLQQRAKSGQALPRRQDLPAEAFADIEELRCSHAALPSHIRAVVLPMLSVSYCWLEPGHPDAEGKQLRTVVETIEAQLITLPKRDCSTPIYAEPWQAFFPDMAVFWDWGKRQYTAPILSIGCHESCIS